MQAQRDRGFEFANGIGLTLSYDIGDAVHAEWHASSPSAR